MKHSSNFLPTSLLNSTASHLSVRCFSYCENARGFLSVPKGLSLCTASTTIFILVTSSWPISCNYLSWFSLPILVVLLSSALLFPDRVSLQIIYIAHHSLSILLMSLAFLLNYIVSIHYLQVSSTALLLSHVLLPLLHHQYSLSLSNENKFDECYICASSMPDKIITFLRQAI